MEVQAPLTPQEVYSAILGATKVELQERLKSESTLRSWESEAAPGFLDSLMQIAGQAVMVDEESRLLAAVVAKNAVGSSWRKTLGSREWSRVPEVEKARVRSRAMGILLEDPSERVALQMALLITNIARFDFPSKWPALLTQLVEAASFAAPTSVASKRRALRALKNVVHALRTKRIVAESPRIVSTRMSQQDLMPLAARISQERQQLNSMVEATFSSVKEMWAQNFASILQTTPDWVARGHCANQALLVLREILTLLPSWEGLEEGMRQFLESAHAAATTTASIVPPEGEDHDPNSRLEICGKIFERVTQCVMAAMDRNPVEFASYLPYFLPLYSNNALFMMDAAAVHRIRPKRRILLMRFLARALLCPIYKISWLDEQMSVSLEQSQLDELMAIRPKIVEADRALTDLHTEPQCTQLVESIVTKYLALTPAELDEWQADPEQHVRSADVEATPDADTPRPCGVALLLCMLSRGEGTVALTLIRIASRLQSQSRTPEVVLLQEACYRALGEAFSQLRKLPGVSFPEWYTSELRGLLQDAENQADEAAMHDRALRARAIWLVGICCPELPSNLWCDALVLCTQNLRNKDLVVALTAVSALVGMLTTLIEDIEILEHEEEYHKRYTESEAAGIEAEEAKELQKKITSHGQKMELLKNEAGKMIGLALGLQVRLEEIESRVRVLQLVSITIEVLGDQAQQYLGIIADALPQVWTVASEASSSGKETGAIARLHSALMGVLTHLVDRLGHLATEHSQISQILAPLLALALDLNNPESDTLIEDALKLLRVTLSGSSQLTPTLTALLPRVMQVLQKGRDTAAALGVLEAYILLGKDNLSELLTPYLSDIAIALERCVNAAANAIASRRAALSKDTGGKQGLQQPPQSTVPKETILEAMAAASMCTLLLQLNVDASAFGSTLRGMAMVASSKIVAVESNLNLDSASRSLGSVIEGFLEVLTRVLFNQPQILSWLLGNDVDTHCRFLDRWIAMGSKMHLAEILGNPRMAGLGRLRRHMTTACLCRLVCADASPVLHDERRMARALALALRTIAERPLFEADQRDIDEVLQQQAAGSDAIRDSVMSVRLALTLIDSIRLFDTRASVAAAANAALAHCSRDGLLEHLGMIEPRLAVGLGQLIGENGLPPQPAMAEMMLQNPQPITEAMM